METPDVQYTRSGDTAIAYQVVGDGPIDLVLLDLYGNLLYRWELPAWVDYFERLSSFSRLILLDKPGTGLSDRTRDLPNLETRMDDVRAVMDATHSKRAALCGVEGGGQIAAVFAASYPERTRALCLFNTPARATSAPDYPWGPTPDEWRDRITQVRERWGTAEFSLEVLGKDADIPGYRSIKRSARLANRQRPGRRLRDRLHRSRPPVPEGHSRRVAAPCGH